MVAEITLLLKCEEAASYLGLNRHTLYRLHRAGALVAVHARGSGPGQGYQYTKESLVAFQSTKEAEHAAKAAMAYRTRLMREHGSPADVPTPLERRVGYPVLKAVCAVYEMDRLAFEGIGRGPRVVEMRKVAAWVLRYDRQLGVTAIGRLIRRDHSTVLHHLATLNIKDVEIEWALEEVRARIGPSHAERKSASA